MVLYEITQGKNATQMAGEINRRPHTVMDWIHTYIQRTWCSGSGLSKKWWSLPPFSLEMRNNLLAIALLERLDESACPPQEREDSFQPRWTVKRFVAWLQEKYHLQCCRETCRNALKKLSFSWKKARK